MNRLAADEIGQPKDLPLVSVVVPVFEVEDYAARCVESILRQTYKHLQVVLVDDGSTDGSGDLCDDFARADPRVEVIHQSNMGLGEARNHGIRRCDGDWITFVDSDDWIHPEMVSASLAMTDPDTDMAIVGYQRVGGLDDMRTVPEITVQVLEQREILCAFFGQKHTWLTISCGKLFRRELFSDVTFPAGRLHEDEATTYRLLGAARRVAITNRPLYFYFVNPRSITGAGMTVRHRRDMVTAREEWVGYFTGRGEPALANAALTALLKTQVQLYWSLVETGDDEAAHRALIEIEKTGRRLPLIGSSVISSVYGRLFPHMPGLSARLAGMWNAIRRGVRGRL